MIEFTRFEKGDKCHVQWWDDCEPCTVVKVLSDKKVMVRIDKSRLLVQPVYKWGKGNTGQCINQSDVTWEVTDNFVGTLLLFSVKKHKNGHFWTLTNTPVIPRNQLKKGWKKYYEFKD